MSGLLCFARIFTTSIHPAMISLSLGGQDVTRAAHLKRFESSTANTQVYNRLLQCRILNEEHDKQNALTIGVIHYSRCLHLEHCLH